MPLIHALQQLGSLVAGTVVAGALLYCVVWVGALVVGVIRKWVRD